MPDPVDEDTDVEAEVPRRPFVQGSEIYTSQQQRVQLASGGDINVRVFVPDSVGPHPTVILVHAFQLSSRNYRSYGQHLASWGYTVVMPDLPGNLFIPTPHTELQQMIIDLIDWIDTNPAVLNGRGSTDDIAFAGHSLGGKLVMLAAANDNRVDAIIGIDPVDTPRGPFSQPSTDFPSVMKPHG